MRRAKALALVAAIAIAGCPGVASDADTVTPAPVPTQPSPGPTPTPLPCDVPTAVPPSSPTAATPTDVEPQPTTVPRTATSNTTAAAPPATDPSPIPVDGNAVNATALVERHDRVLREHSYELTRPGLLVQADPTGPSLRVRARSSVSAIRHYVVDGTRYSYSFRYGGQSRYSTEPYDAETFRRGFESSHSLTGSDWLSDALTVGSHRVDSRRPNGWVVLRGKVTREDDVATTADRDTPLTDGLGRWTAADSNSPTVGDRSTPTGDRSIRRLNSTVVVDSRGVVRSVDQRYQVREDEGAWRTVNRSFGVTDVGAADVERPAWVCIAERNSYVEVP